MKTHDTKQSPPPLPPSLQAQANIWRLKPKKMHLDRVGPYKLGRTIGQGTYGKVKLASHIETGEKAAIKIIEKSQLQLRKNRDRLKREIKFLRLLHHPNIVKVYDVQEADGCIYIIMEYASGGELFDYIVAHVRVKEDEARCFFRQVLSAIDYCHKNAVIHRDLKPENLLLDDKKTIKIIDFGFGNNFSFDNLLETFCGSPFYAAPEMILGKKYEGPEVDLWSLGVILFALLCGHLPFDDENIKDLYRKIANGLYSCPDYISPKARHLIERLIQVDPRTRATLSEVIHHPWVNEGYDTVPLSYMTFRPLIKDVNQLDQNVVAAMQSFGWKKETFERDWLACQNLLRPSPMRATYWLIKEMRERRASESRRKYQQPKTNNSSSTNKPPSNLTDMGQSEPQHHHGKSVMEGTKKEMKPGDENAGNKCNNAPTSGSSNNNGGATDDSVRAAVALGDATGAPRGEALDRRSERQQYHGMTTTLQPAKVNSNTQGREVEQKKPADEMSLFTTYVNVKHKNFGSSSSENGVKSGPNVKGIEYASKREAESAKGRGNDDNADPFQKLPLPLVATQAKKQQPNGRDGNDIPNNSSSGDASSTRASLFIKEYVHDRLYSDTPSKRGSEEMAAIQGGEDNNYSYSKKKLKDRDAVDSAAAPPYLGGSNAFSINIPDGMEDVSSLGDAYTTESMNNNEAKNGGQDNKSRNSLKRGEESGCNRKTPGSSLRRISAKTKAETINLTKVIPEKIFSQSKRNNNNDNEATTNLAGKKQTAQLQLPPRHRTSLQGSTDCRNLATISQGSSKKGSSRRTSKNMDADNNPVSNLFNRINQKNKNEHYYPSNSHNAARKNDEDYADKHGSSEERGSFKKSDTIQKPQQQNRQTQTGRVSKSPTHLPLLTTKFFRTTPPDPAPSQTGTVTVPPNSHSLHSSSSIKKQNSSPESDNGDVVAFLQSSGGDRNQSAEARKIPLQTTTPSSATPTPGKKFSWFRRLSNSLRESQNNHS